ncbi:MAG: Si-specific NAD(P)(+) transhydrogenase [Gammaproteobacteria bacterium]|nr:Si-specific NAD(P)(+) transhydrogenase [Gammaproteobacteria bacterium]
MEKEFDIIVIGSGPAGQRAAVQGAKLGRRVAIIERDKLGGGCLHTGTIPSKTLREAILYLTGYHQRAFYGQGYRLKPNVNMADLKQRLNQVVGHETAIINHQLTRNGIRIVNGEARFVDSHTVAILGEEDNETLELRAEHIIIAVGSSPFHPPLAKVDGKHVLDSDQLLELDQLPRSMTVLGGGIIGIEYASMLTNLDIDITLIDGRDSLLGFVDKEIADSMTFYMRNNGIRLLLGERCRDAQHVDGGMLINLESGKQVRSESLLYATGRQSNTAKLNLAAAGLEANERGLMMVNENYQTRVEHIYAVGDVIGFPALAATSNHQGRAAAYHACKHKAVRYSDFMPFGIYGVPAISMIGKTEEELTKEGIAYEVGSAQFRETARGQILGLEDGLMKLLFAVDDRRLLGVHIIGEGATELVHVGQAVMSLNGTLDYFLHTVFNYPTLTGATYKIAALDAYNKLEQLDAGSKLPSATA